MEPGRDSAPPVVAVMVVHLPGPDVPAWFDEVLASVARQDYANLRALFLLVGDPGVLPERIRAAVPQAFVRSVEGNPGFGAVANEVLHLVEGDNGFFCFLHDDVALDPDAIRLLVEELYRSNAGVVGPKLVEWDDPTRLQHVGFGVDRFGETDPIVEHGEVDQEQHDAVRDVFALPSACLLVRADLFRSLGGFDPQISFHGEDLELCWRAHRSGARVVVVPSARARHRERLLERRPDLPHETLRARHRMRAVATLSAGRRLPLLSIELTLVTFAELLIGLVTGGARRGIAGLRALVGLVPRTFALLARRRALAPQRHVPDREVIGLQIRGSARLAAYLRSRDMRPDPDRTQWSWRERAGASGVIAWAVLLIAVVVGSRELITGGVPSIGQFLPYPADAGDALRQATSGWWPHGGGATRAAPTGLAVVALSSVVTLFDMSVLHTLGVVGMLVLGPLGTWRLSTAFTTNRARIVALAVYAAVPLPGELVSTGRWSALACYAATPWVVDGLRRAAGIVAGDGGPAAAAARPGSASASAAGSPGDDATGAVELLATWGGPAASGDAAEVVHTPAGGALVRVVAGTSLVVALAVAFAPGFVVVVPLVALAMGIATFLAGTRWVAGLRILLAGFAVTLAGALLALPWFATLLGDGGWTAIVGPDPIGDRGRSVVDLASFDVGNMPAAVLALALLVPVLAAPLLGRGWRFGWALRAAALVLGFIWLAVLDERGALPVRLPEAGVLLAPAAVGVAIAAGCLVAAFELDVRGGSFGWRQPIGLLATGAIAVGVVPGVVGLTSGRYELPSTTMAELAVGRLPDPAASGDYRVLWVGDQRILPAAGQPYRSGVGYALTDGRSLEVGDAWPTRSTGADESIVAALDAIADGSTARAGRLLAPFAVRYVIIPVIDGAISRTDDILPVPAGLQDALGDQLDLGLQSGSPNFVLYENRAWLPLAGILTEAGAQASETAGAGAIARTDLSGATPIMVGLDQLTAGIDDVPAGTLHLAVPFDRRWVLTVDGVGIPARPAFGATLAFDVPAAGRAVLRYEGDTSRVVQLVVQLVAWVLVALLALGARLPRRVVRRRRGIVGGAGPVLTLGTIDAPGSPDAPDAPDARTSGAAVTFAPAGVAQSPQQPGAGAAAPPQTAEPTS